ncbi:MAG: DsbC family protein [Herminiimonas sp.]|nr:DsbC family protein [Herminiimonas sp.]
MKHTKVAISILLACAAASSFAETAQEAAVKKLIEPRLGNNAKVESVVKTPYSNLYEVRTGGDIIYTDEKAQYLFVGHVIDTKTYKDYTKSRIEEISKIKFSDLPLDLAMKTVKGDGKRVIAVFEDPNCGYCKKFRQTLQDVENVTVYTFMYNILSEDSVIKSKNIWCSTDRIKAWDDWMLNGKAAAPASATCVTPNEKVMAFGKKLKITGTPTIFFADGTRIPGAVDEKSLEEKFASLK